MAQFDAVLKQIKPLLGIPAILQILRKDWDALGVSGQREMFSRTCVHVKGPGGNTPLQLIQDFDPTNWEWYLDMTTPRHCHGSCNSHMVQGMLSIDFNPRPVDRN